MPSEPKQEPAKQPSKKKVFAAIRWTLAQAASEFNINPRTVSARVKAAGILPGADKKFSTVDIHSAICGDYERERTRKMTEDADAQALANAETRGHLTDKDDLFRRLDPIFTAMKQKILNLPIADADKDDILSELSKLCDL